jgi:hypothetical protein
MSDPIDFLGLNEQDEQAKEKSGLVLSDKVGGHELRLLDRIRVDGAREEYIGKVQKWKSGDRWNYDTSRAIFAAEEDNPDGSWKWDEDPEKPSIDPETKKPRTPGERWRVIMGWPVGTEPQPADAIAFMENGMARLRAKWWPELMAARARDEAAARGEDEPG